MSEKDARYEYKTKEEVMLKSEGVIGIPFSQFLKGDNFKNSKGSLGILIEESYFGYAANSDSEPDFPLAGVELKVTPYIRNKNNTVSSKERLVLNIINYMKECDMSFYESSFWTKNKCLQIMFYEHRSEIPKESFFIDHTIQYSYPEEDFYIIKNDWDIISNKIKKGLAHEISESDTMYLAACTKGANSSSMRDQPNSEVLAKQRAYSLKQSYMTTLLRTHVFGEKQDERIIKNSSRLINESFESIILASLRPYFGKNRTQLLNEFGIASKAKNVSEILISKILGINKNVSETDEFQKASIKVKTIKMRPDGYIKENMSFPAFRFCDLVEQNWDESFMYQTLSESKFLFVIFIERKNELVLDEAFFWNMPDRDLEKFETVWERTKTIIKNGVVLTNRGGKVFNNLPKESESDIGHVRPKAIDSSDTFPLPDGRNMTKQCFWLNRKYIEKQIKSHKQIGNGFI